MVLGRILENSATKKMMKKSFLVEFSCYSSRFSHLRNFLDSNIPGTFLNIKVAFPTVWDFFLLSNCFTQFKIQSFEMFWFLTQESCFQCNLNVEKATSSFNSIFLINL